MAYNTVLQKLKLKFSFEIFLQIFVINFVEITTIYYIILFVTKQKSYKKGLCARDRVLNAAGRKLIQRLGF